MNPQSKLVADVDCLQVRRCPEFFEARSLCSLDLSVQVRRARGNRSEPYGFIHQTALDLLSEGFRASVRLHPLN